MKRPAIRVRLGLVAGGLLLCSLPARGQNPLPVERVFTNEWQLDDLRPIPVEQEDATPFVAGVDPKQRLWIADQRNARVLAFNDRGRERANASVSRRGPVIAIDFDRSDTMMVVHQRLHEAWPMNNVRLYNDINSSKRNITLMAQWGAPFWWAWDSVADVVSTARVAGGYNQYRDLTVPHLHVAAMNRKGTTYLAYPLLSEIEKFSSKGRLMAAYNPSNVDSFTPVWLLCTRSGNVVAGDVQNERIILMDQAGRVQRMWPCPGVATALVCAHPDRGWVLLNRAGSSLTFYDNDGTALLRWHMPARNWCGVLMPDGATVWLFDKQTWTWLTYDHR
jgi:hypothetical protein